MNKRLVSARYKKYNYKNKCAMATTKQELDLFNLFAKKISLIIGNAWVFVLMLFSVIIWLILGPFFHFSDTWQLFINTATTVITFLIVFVLQNSQNRDTQAIQLKLNELIRCHKLAHNSLIDLDKLSDKERKSLERHYLKISKKEENN